MTAQQQLDLVRRYAHLSGLTEGATSYALYALTHYGYLDALRYVYRVRDGRPLLPREFLVGFPERS